MPFPPVNQSAPPGEGHHVPLFRILFLIMSPIALRIALDLGLLGTERRGTDAYSVISFLR
jgi:hypothetical protein